MARLRNSEWAMMIVQRLLELDPKYRNKFLDLMTEFHLLDNGPSQDYIKRIVNNVLKNCEKPDADLRILGKAKSGLTKINDRENVMEKHIWNIISQHQPGDSPDTLEKQMAPFIKYCERRIKRGKKTRGTSLMKKEEYPVLEQEQPKKSDKDQRTESNRGQRNTQVKGKNDYEKIISIQEKIIKAHEETIKKEKLINKLLYDRYLDVMIDNGNWKFSYEKLKTVKGKIKNVEKKNKRGTIGK